MERRETLIDGHWTVSGITTPINRETGERYTEKTGYLDEHVVPAEMRAWDPDDDEQESTERKSETARHLPNPNARPGHGRPPSKWLRSPNAEETAHRVGDRRSDGIRRERHDRL